MFQGTGSDVGKSLMVAGLARALTNRGLKVRPFKPQNMSNNAAVTADGGEIGRAQALQARAARVPASVHMNPVLLKPQSEVGAQIVVQGRVHGTAKAAAYQHLKPDLMPFVLDSYGRLRREADLVLVEGAGSASEVNLRANDIANMGFARAADVPVVLIGDIDRGGVIASLVGTKEVIDASDAAMILGFLVNKLRGDPTLFADGMATIARMTGWGPLGLVPFFPDARLLPAEDALALDAARAAKRSTDQDCRPDPAARRQLRRSRSSRRRARRGLVRVRPGHALPGDADLVLLSAPKRRSPTRGDCARRDSTSTSARMCVAAAAYWDCAADIRCSGAPSAIRLDSRDPPAPPRASACLTWRQPCPRTSGSSRCTARPATAFRSRATRCIWV